MTNLTAWDCEKNRTGRKTLGKFPPPTELTSAGSLFLILLNALLSLCLIYIFIAFNTIPYRAYYVARVKRQSIFLDEMTAFPSVLWRCWLGDRKGIRPVETGCWSVGGNNVAESFLHDLWLQLSPPIPSSLASIKLANPGSRGKMAGKTEREWREGRKEGGRERDDSLRSNGETDRCRMQNNAADDIEISWPAQLTHRRTIIKQTKNKYETANRISNTFK